MAAVLCSLHAHVPLAALRCVPPQDFYHLEPAFNCLFEGGKPVVDSLVRYEKLDEDIEDVISLVNERRAEGQRPLKRLKELPWKKPSHAVRSHISHAQQQASNGKASGSGDQGSDRGGGSSGNSTSGCSGSGDGALAACAAVSAHAAKYRACGRECADNIAKFYSEDARLLGFSFSAPPAPQP
jgi:hypothetical protein